jgi:hypothetical protein
MYYETLLKEKPPAVGDVACSTRDWENFTYIFRCLVAGSAVLTGAKALRRDAD